jgi:signal transduction histidine kinase
VYRFQFVEGSPAADARTAVQEEVDHLRLLLDVMGMINSSLALDQALEHVIDAVIKITRAERGFLMMLNPSGNLEFRVARNFDQTALSTEGVSASFSVVEQVRQSGKPIVLSYALDADASAAPNSVVALGLRSVMCVPMKTAQRFIGVIYVDSHRLSQRFFERDLEIFNSLASQAALGIEKSQLYEELRRYSSSLEEQVRQRTEDLVRVNDGLQRAYGELQQAQADIIQAEKHAAVGRLAAGIAHEINSPLGVITSNVDMLYHLIRRIAPTLSPPSQPNEVDPVELLDTIARSSIAASDRLRRLMKAFEAFTGLDQADLRPININQVIDSAMTLLEHELGRGIRIVREFGELRPVTCSPGRIHQAFMNLLVNGVQSLSAEGTLTIRTEQLAAAVRITIQDDGRGMTPHEIAEAFDTGFSRKGTRVGARLGLMITGQIIRGHRGDIQIESTPGVGTTITVTLPNDYVKKDRHET